MGLRDRLKQGRGAARAGAKKVVSRVLGKILGPGDDDPYGTYGGKDPDELTRVYKEMSKAGGKVEAGSLNRPRASRTTGARFDHYPILMQEGRDPWDIGPGLVEPVRRGREDDGKEVLFVAIVPEDDDGDQMEHDLAVLHPHLDPQYIVAIARVAPGTLPTLKIGPEAELSPPRIPLILAFDLPDAHTLRFKAASVGAVEGDVLRAVLLETLFKNSPHGPMAGDVSAQLMGPPVRLE